ncbi:MAG: MFS transporter [Myxococcota bacterium]
MALDASSRSFVAVCVGVLFATSVWFSGTAAQGALSEAWGLGAGAEAALTTVVQVGFIVGTLIFATTNLADLYDARNVLLGSALVAAACNAAFALSDGLGVALVARALTGVAMAGVYPVGMKIIASWSREGLGWRLGVMVGALTLGTALPFLLRAVGASFNWRVPVAVSSGLCVAGGLLVRLGAELGPHGRTRARFDPRMLVKCFSYRSFRLAAVGYFGHMWELYAFWAMVAGFLAAAFAGAPGWGERVPLLAFFAIASGTLGCVVGGRWSRRAGERRVALTSLIGSGALAALSPFAFDLPPALLVAFVLAWGFLVVMDSAQFSSLAAQNAPPDYVGTALTIQNGIGFAITIVSIQLVPWLAAQWGWRNAFVVLALGPLVGALATARLPRAA